MQIKKKNTWINLISFLIFFFTFIIHSTDIIDLSIKNAVPLTVIPLLTAFAVFYSPTASATAGLIMGICMDSVSSDSVCFNAIVLLVCTLLISVFSDTLFNRNIRATVILCLIFATVYFCLRWLVFYAFTYSVDNSAAYLLSYAIPSIVYTTLFIFPFYYLYIYLFKNN